MLERIISVDSCNTATSRILGCTGFNRCDLDKDSSEEWPLYVRKRLYVEAGTSVKRAGSLAGSNQQHGEREQEEILSGSGGSTGLGPGIDQADPKPAPPRRMRENHTRRVPPDRLQTADSLHTPTEFETS